MKIDVEKVPDLENKRKYLISYNGHPVILCGKNKKDLILSVIYRGVISEDIPLHKSKQGKILKRIDKINTQCNSN